MAEEEAKISTKNAAKRVKGVSIEKPFVVGSMAWQIPKKEESQTTHKWTIYLRSWANEDMSYFIKKVVFNLHPSFGERAKRTVEAAPYEIEDVGWGEFEVNIRVYFQDATEKPLDLYHGLRLYPQEGQVVHPKKPVVSEFYDEFVFCDPTETNLKRLKAGGALLGRSVFAEHFVDFGQDAELKKIKHAHKKVKSDIAHLKEQYDNASAKIEVPEAEREATVQ